MREQFARAAGSYGTGGTSWHRAYAERLVEVAALRPGATVIDACCGNGLASFAAARAVGPAGSVVGIDVVEEMVVEARRRVVADAVGCVRFAVGDAASLPDVPSASVDAVVCSSALVYLPIAEALREWRRVLRPGGRVAFSTWQVDSPRVSALFRSCARRYGVDLPDPNAALGTSEQSAAALRAAGFTDIRVVDGVVATEPQERDWVWEQQSGAAVHRLFRSATRETQDAIREAFAASVTDGDLCEPMRVLYAVADRPA